MADNERKFSRELGKVLDQATVRIIRSPEMSPEQIISLFDEIEAKFLPKVAENPALALETKRRIAERKLTEYMGRNLPYESTMPLLEKLYDLGFSTIEMRANYEIIFAKYCQRQMQKHKAKEILLKLRHDINEALRKENLILYREVRRKIETLLRALNGLSA
jgi:hypothetical protein